MTTHQPTAARRDEAAQQPAADIPAGAVRLEVGMRTVIHTAVEAPSGHITCQCGIERDSRAALARAHQRSALVRPSVYEA